MFRGYQFIGTRIPENDYNRLCYLAEKSIKNNSYSFTCLINNNLYKFKFSYSKFRKEKEHFAIFLVFKATNLELK